MAAGMTSSSLTEDIVLQYRKAFAAAAPEKEEAGKISLKDLGIVMRSLGMNPTEAELQDMINEVDGERKGTIEFHEFLNIMEGEKDYNESEDEILSAFRVFDYEGTGFVSAEELRDVLTTLGEKMTGEEVEELFGEGEIDDDGLINYHDLCKAVLE